MNNVDAIRKANESELELALAGTTGSWHEKYAQSPVIYIGGLPRSMVETDILAIFEQFGRVVHVNLVREKETGKSRGFAFVAYHDQRSTVLAVDNFNGIKLQGNTIGVDHVENYRRPEADDNSAALSLPVSSDEERFEEDSAGPHAAPDPIAEGKHRERSPHRSSGTANDASLQRAKKRLAEMREKRAALEASKRPADCGVTAREQLGDSSAGGRAALDPHDSARHILPDTEATAQVPSDKHKRERLERKEARKRIREERALRRANRRRHEDDERTSEW